MRAAAIGCALVVAGCGTQSAGPFLIDTADCALVNNFKLDGAATKWTDCRVHWSGEPTNILSVELTVPNTTGSFLSPGADWVRASVHVPAGGVSGDLTVAAFEPADELPAAVPHGMLPLDLWLGMCGNVGAAMTGETASVMADVGGSSVSFSLSIDGSCTQLGGAMSTFSGGFILTAAAKADAMTTADPSTLVSVTE